MSTVSDNKTSTADFKYAASAEKSSSTGLSADAWKDVLPQYVGHADAMSPHEVEKVWRSIYEQTGMRTASERERMSVRLAVYIYAMINGTSRAGDYGGKMRLQNGKEIDAGVIPKATSKFKIRQFFRGNMTESYHALKSSEAAILDERFVKKCEGLGVTPQCAFATADWFDDCPLLGVDEVNAHHLAKISGLERARRNRGGRNLEEVESDERHEALRISGPLNQQDVQSVQEKGL